ncbi:MAG: branched-chain amino acid ABC transporter permease [Chloroflexi bacterium]|nr:branched-chain amino acid ABC transporter permease [Chloroflexota bacterium]
MSLETTYPAGGVFVRSGKLVFWLVMLAALAAFPILTTSAYSLSTLTEILIFGIFAMSLDLLLGYTGLISFGHAAFFGVGAYTAGLVAIKIAPNMLLTMAAGIVVCAIAAFVIGFFSIRAAGVFFLMLTLAFSQMVYAIAHQWTWLTGGSNGLAGIPRPNLSVPSLPIEFYDPTKFYYITLGIFVISLLLLKRIVSSPFGHVLLGIRENEGRMKAVGYNTRNFKLAAFVIAGAFGGLSGVLYSYFNGFISPSELYWTMSGQVMVMVIIGGAGTLVGPVLGAGTILLLQNIVSSNTERWPTIMGMVFIFFVLLARNGITGLLDKVWHGARSQVWKH